MTDLLALIMQEAAGDMPGWFPLAATGWAVGITTGLFGAVLTGNLRLGREVKACEESCEEAVKEAREASARELGTLRDLWTEEKSRRITLSTALDETLNDLRMNNKALLIVAETAQKSGGAGGGVAP